MRTKKVRKAMINILQILAGIVEWFFDHPFVLAMIGEYSLVAVCLLARFDVMEMPSGFRLVAMFAVMLTGYFILFRGDLEELF